MMPPPMVPNVIFSPLVMKLIRMTTTSLCISLHCTRDDNIASQVLSQIRHDHKLATLWRPYHRTKTLTYHRCHIPTHTAGAANICLPTQFSFASIKFDTNPIVRLSPWHVRNRPLSSILTTSIHHNILARPLCY